MNSITKIRRNSRLRMLLTLLFALAGGSAAAETCAPFLDVRGPDRQDAVLSLSTCELEASVPWTAQSGAGVWRLMPDARARWRTALSGDRLRAGLFAATLRVRPANPAQASGPLLLRISARQPAPAAWRWDEQNGELALVPHPTQAGACTGPGGLMLWDKTQDVSSGSQTQAKVLRARRPGVVERLPEDCVDAWEIETTPYASIDQTGLIKMHEGIPDGALITVTAVVGERRINGKLRVFDARQHLLKGTWRQVSERTCDGAAERTPSDPIRELVFDAGGQFSVTLRPFEVYKDYWGEYRHDPSSGAVVMSKETGNKVPAGLRLQGHAKVTGNELVFNDVVLWPAADGAKLCSLRFTR